MSEPVTYVNAPLLAEERGLVVSTLTSTAVQDYVSLVRLYAGEVRVAGTLIGPANRERLVEAWGFPIDMEPTDRMAFFRYADRPGIIGLRDLKRRAAAQSWGSSPASACTAGGSPSSAGVGSARS